jgi:hypothetical protein
MNPKTASRVHLQNSETNYLKHFYQAFKLEPILIWPGIASILNSTPLLRGLGMYRLFFGKADIFKCQFDRFFKNRE